MSPLPIELLSTTCFGLAVLHTFMVKRFQAWAARARPGSPSENLLHLLGEVEVVFGLWAGLFLSGVALAWGPELAITFLEGRHVLGDGRTVSLGFDEPLFVFVVMGIASTRPVLDAATRLITAFSKLLPLPRDAGFAFAALALGPLAGSLITEPAAMTVTALLLRDRLLRGGVSTRLLYTVTAVLFVNVSIGGVLTAFAAPPVLMVAGQWHWDSAHMLGAFGWKATLAVLLNAGGLVALNWRELWAMSRHGTASGGGADHVPLWVVAVHLAVLAAVVATSHHPVLFVGLFLFFLGIAKVTAEYQDELSLQSGLLVGFFLGGLVVLGALQGWWLSPLLSQLTALPLFLGATSLTAIADNAALTYLGSQVPGLDEASRYALVAGAVTGGGLTVIANAPNPAGFGILKGCFGEEGIGPVALFAHAVPPTLVAAACFWWL